MRSLLFFVIVFSTLFCDPAKTASSRLLKHYERHVREPSDINEHLPVLRQLASECSSVVEIGLRDMVSTWGILQGLAESPFQMRQYIGIDIAMPPVNILGLVKRASKENGIAFDFWQANDMHIDIPPVDMLFIDSYHTYCHLTYELEKFSPKVGEYIAMHDTSGPWGDTDEGYSGDYSEYPPSIDRNKRGLWTAVEDFLGRHPEWVLQERRFNCNGFTVLRRK